MKRPIQAVLPVLLAISIAGCMHAQAPSAPAPAPVAKLKDGEIAVPANYRSWPAMILNVQRPDVKQIRDMYINDIGHRTAPGGKFANGTISVMELYKAKVDAEGNAIKGVDGNMVKGDLLKVFVMAKGEDWGESAPAGLKNGDWIYAGYGADGKTASNDPIAACRGCHLPLGEGKDFVHRYDEYFQKRKS